MAEILWVFLVFHEKFFIIPLSEDVDLTFQIIQGLLK